MKIDTVGVYWKSRRETAQECAFRLRHCLDALAQQFPALAAWYQKGARPDENTANVAEISGDKLLSLVESGVNRKDAGGQPIPQLGFGIGLWNGGPEGARAGMTIRCGLASQNKALSNAVVMELPNDLQALALDSDEALERLLLLLATVWEADWGAVFSTSSDAWARRTGPGPFLDRLLWLRRGHNTFIVADGVTSEPAADGTIYTRRSPVMGTDQARKVSEEEFYFVEQAFSEYRDYSATGKKCPWCGGELRFDDRGSAHAITCSSCDLKVTVRGL
jgi:hypothetical protein